MVAANHTTIRHEGSRFSYADACQMAARVLAGLTSEITFLQLESVARTSTAALARLILLRRDLLKRGRDLRITGLRGRAKGLYELNRMARLLPRGECPRAGDTRAPIGEGIRP